MSLELVVHVGPTAGVDMGFSVGTDGHVVMHGNVVCLITLLELAYHSSLHTHTPQIAFWQQSANHSESFCYAEKLKVIFSGVASFLSRSPTSNSTFCKCRLQNINYSIYSSLWCLSSVRYQCNLCQWAFYAHIYYIILIYCYKRYRDTDVGWIFVPTELKTMVLYVSLFWISKS